MKLHPICTDKIKEYTRVEFEALCAAADWCIKDNADNMEARCVTLVVYQPDGKFTTMVFTSIEETAVECVDVRENLSYRDAINQVCEQMVEEHQYDEDEK